MANVNDYIVTIDTTGVVTTDKLVVQSVEVIPSADNHLVVLQDNDENEIFRNTSGIANHKTPGPGQIGPTLWKGINAITLTNITRVFVRLTYKEGMDNRF